MQVAGSSENKTWALGAVGQGPLSVGGLDQLGGGLDQLGASTSWGRGPIGCLDQLWPQSVKGLDMLGPRLVGGRDHLGALISWGPQLVGGLDQLGVVTSLVASK